jgi:hypothetical protein
MFQNKVNLTPAPAVAGDFASSNPRASVLAGPGGFVTGLAGVTVGKFAWVESDGKSVTNYGQGNVAPAGFVHREQQALITNFLGEASNLIPQGFPVVLHNQGDFWAVNNGPAASKIGDAVYADFADGSVFLVSAPAGTTATGSDGSTNTASLGSTFTATATGNQLAVTAVTGLISIGDVISGTGVPAGTTILAQVSGTAGGAGTYTTSVVTTAAAATVTSFGSVMKVTATTGLVSIGDTVSGGAGFPVGATIIGNPSAGIWTLSAPGTAYTASATGVTTFGVVLDVTATVGALAVGDAISGTGIPAGATIESQVSGVAGGVGIYTLNVPATAYAASTALTTLGGIAVTGWTAQSVAAVGELVKISTWN